MDAVPCYTCLITNSEDDMVSLTKTGSDKITFLEKIIVCIGHSLVWIPNMRICTFCQEELNAIYKFLKQLQNTQLAHKTRLFEQITEHVEIYPTHRNYDEFEDNNSPTHTLMEECSTLDNASSDGSSDCFLSELRNNIKANNKLGSITNSRKNKFRGSKTRLVHIRNKLRKKYIKIDGTVVEAIADDSGGNGHSENVDTTTDATEECCEKPSSYRCLLCSEHFKTKIDYSDHRKTHSVDDKFFCEHCGKSYISPRRLKEHMATHTGEKEFKCNICYKTFHRISSYSRHKNIHRVCLPGQKTKRTPYLCHICGKNFPFSNSLQVHLRVHNNIKRFQCNVCNKWFRETHHLKQHMPVHTGEKPFVCHVCGVSFKFNSTLRKHQETHQTSSPSDHVKEMVVISCENGVDS